MCRGEWLGFMSGLYILARASFYHVLKPRTNGVDLELTVYKLFLSTLIENRRRGACVERSMDFR